MAKVFISHRWAEGEHDFARELKKKLESYEDITVFLDEYEMLPGGSWDVSPYFLRAANRRRLEANSA